MFVYSGLFFNAKISLCEPSYPSGTESIAIFAFAIPEIAVSTIFDTVFTVFVV